MSAPDDPALAQHQKLAAELGLTASGPSTPDPYFNVGEPHLLDAAVLFLDLLGTRGERTPDQANAHLRLTFQAVRQARQWSSAGSDKHQEGALYSFSDNISMGYPVHGAWDSEMALWHVVLDSAHLQLAFLVHGLFSRGGIAFNLFFADPGLDFLHGPALNRAVELEHQVAIYPRVVLDQQAVDQIREAMRGEDRDATIEWREALLSDEDGLIFISYLHVLLDEVLPDVPGAEVFLPRHRDLIESSLRQFEGVDRVEAKYRWAAAYHNHFLAEFADELPAELPRSCRIECPGNTRKFVMFDPAL